MQVGDCGRTGIGSSSSSAGTKAGKDRKGNSTDVVRVVQVAGI